MSRSCQSATFSSPTSACAAHDAREAADPLGDDRVALVRHRRRALLALAERLLDLAHLGAREVADLERELLERRRRRARARRAARRAGRAGGSASRPAPARGRGARTRAARARDRSPRRCRRRRRACRRASPRARARAASRPRSSSNAQPASLSPKVVGSAWTPCVRPIADVVAVLLARARRRRRARASMPVEEERAGLADLQRRAPVSTTSDEVRP